MPIYLPPISRRRFLAGSAAAGACLVAGRFARADAPPLDPHRLLLLADTHIAADPELENAGIKMAAHLRLAVAELLQTVAAPVRAIVNGDCAFRDGQAGDYQLFGQLCQPLRTAGWPLHLTLGNHDDRTTFYDVQLKSRPDAPPVADKHVAIVETERANWFLLDSLMKVNVVTGELGEAQRTWLARELDRRADKPAIVVAHHPGQWDIQPNQTPSGIADTKDFWDVIAARKQVKMFVFGHTHEWSVRERDGIHLVNLPPVSYVFRQGAPAGWVDAALAADGVQLKFNALDKQHAAHGEAHRLVWRT